MLRDLTTEDATALRHALASRFHVVFEKKGEGMTAPAVKLAALAVEAVGIVTGGDLTAEAWIDDWGTTVGNIVLMPRRELSPDEDAELALHETTHGVQFLRAVVTGDVLEDIRAPFLWSYVVSPEARARYEADAFATAIELGIKARGWGRAECLRYIDHAAAALKNYALGAGDIALATQILESRAASLLAGTTSLSAVTAFGLDVLRARGAL